MGKYMNPLLDFSFKRLFGQDANKELLIDFLNILFEGERKVEDFNLEADECKTDFERWIYLFKNMDTLERIPFETKKATFKKLLKAAEVESLNSGDRWLYDKILKNYRDYVNTVEYAKVEGERRGIKIGREKGIAEGKMKGIEIGIEKGRKEEKHLLAIQLKKEGLPFDFISRLTGLPPEEIKLL